MAAMWRNMRKYNVNEIISSWKRNGVTIGTASDYEASLSVVVVMALAAGWRNLNRGRNIEIGIGLQWLSYYGSLCQAALCAPTAAAFTWPFS